MKKIMSVLTILALAATLVCAAAAADNAGCVHSYYVRLPQKCLDVLPAENVETELGVARVITRPMSVKEMHSIAAQLRDSGESVFFAAIGG